MQNNQSGDLSPKQLQNFNQPSPQPTQPPVMQKQKKTPKIKPWIINTVMIVGLFIVVLSLPEDKIKEFVQGVIGISALVVLFEGSRIEIKKYPATLLGRGPWSYAFMTLILWLFTFPFFISRRYKILNGELQMKEKYRKPKEQ